MSNKNPDVDFSALSSQLFPEGSSFVERVTTLLTTKADAKDLISQTRSLIGPDHALSKDEIATCFRVVDDEQQTLYLMPSMQRNKSRRSAACNIMRLWLIDYMVGKSQELNSAPNAVQWYSSLPDTAKAQSTDELWLLFSPEKISNNNKRKTARVAHIEFTKMQWDDSHRPFLHFSDLKPAPKHDCGVLSESNALLEQMSPSELQKYIDKLRSTRYSVYGYFPDPSCTLPRDFKGHVDKFVTADILQRAGFPVALFGFTDQLKPCQRKSDFLWVAEDDNDDDDDEGKRAVTTQSVVGALEDAKDPRDDDDYDDDYDDFGDFDFDDGDDDYDYDDEYDDFGDGDDDDDDGDLLSDVIVEEDQVSPFKPFFGSSRLLPDLCKKLGFDLAYTPYDYFERKFCYEHTFATNINSSTLKMALGALKRIKLTDESESLIARYKLRSDVVYGESSCIPLLFNFYDVSLSDLVKNNGKNPATKATPDNDVMSLLLQAGATAGFCVFPLETIRDNFIQDARSTESSDECGVDSKAKTKTKVKVKRLSNGRVSKKDRLLQANEEQLFDDLEQHAAYTKAVAAIADKIGQHICKSKGCVGMVKNIGYARSIKYLYVDFLIFDSDAFKAAVVGLQDSALAKKHGLSSCSFQTFSRYAPIYTFYGKAPVLDASPEF